MDILKFITAGNVDDGKSTLIGRLLYDTQNIKADILESIGADAVSHSSINLAHFTDGLRAERTQGITIDVAYKYFTTTQRKYIITDAPGHFQYTRNLVTGASGVDVIIILIDALNGITEQTRRHSQVASFLKIPNVAVAINKMDAVGHDEQIFTKIKNEYKSIEAKLGLPPVTFIPISALRGDNVTRQSTNMAWYKGDTLIEYLEACVPNIQKGSHSCFSVQHTIQTEHGTGYLGRMISGSFNFKGVAGIFPKDYFVMITKIIHNNTEVDSIDGGQNACIYLGGEGRAKRGDIVARYPQKIKCEHLIEISLCWLNAEKSLQQGAEYILRIHAMETVCTIKKIISKTDVTTFEEYQDNKPVKVNQFAKVIIEATDKIAYYPFDVVAEMGRGILIDKVTNYTSGAFTIFK